MFICYSQISKKRNQICKKRNQSENQFASNGRGITFDREGSWNFGNDFVGDAVIFGVDNNSPSHTVNKKKKISALVVGPNDNNDNSTAAAENNSLLTLVKPR